MRFLWGSCSSFGGRSHVGKVQGQPTSLCSLQAQPFTGGLPAQQTLPITGEKQHQVLRKALDNLTNVMNGYCLPEPYFSTKVGAGRRRQSRCPAPLPHVCCDGKTGSASGCRQH